jgi:hypothetical protein
MLRQEQDNNTAPAFHLILRPKERHTVHGGHDCLLDKLPIHLRQHSRSDALHLHHEGNVQSSQGLTLAFLAGGPEREAQNRRLSTGEAAPACHSALPCQPARNLQRLA